MASNTIRRVLDLFIGHSLDANTDLDTFIKVGKWSSTQTTVVSSLANKPHSASECAIINIPFSQTSNNANYGVQIFLYNNGQNSGAYIRGIIGGVPKTWTEIYS